MDKEQSAAKEKDVDQIVRYLTKTFNTVTAKMERPSRNPKTGKINDLYRLQTEFAYLLNELTQGPRSILQKNIALCNEYIDQVMQQQTA